ncbi:MAG TPA: enoyl-CoA hydratase/isomerase family protein [Polyangiaceae bacterium]|nr:enoyl-CoA hydratase/isomerase family protein [Polyangiaceae bacterium]
MGKPLRLELGPVARIVLDRPEKHNALSVEMGMLLRAAVAEINASEETRVVVVQGEGRAFCAGGDFDIIDASSRQAPEENRRAMLEFYGSFLSLLRVRVPTIARIHGAAVGAGLALALACDVRFAANEAKLGANFVRVGLHPGMGCSLLLPHVVGPAKAAELIYTGQLIDGTEAARIGLVNKALPAGTLETETSGVVEQILKAAPIAVMQAKATLMARLWSRLDEALSREASAQAIDFGTEDLREAVAAFRAGRTPTFAGR